MRDEAEIDILARTIWGESRSEGREGMEAVAAVIMNRVRFPRWWGDTITSVVLMPWQFSPWNANDLNLPLMQAVTTTDPQFREALHIAERAAAGVLDDPTDWADHFHTHQVKPPWSRGRHPTVIIKNHLFFRLEIRP